MSTVMLSREVMGVLALAILWINTLLVMGAAGKELSRLLRLARRARPLRGTGEGMVRGRIQSGAGPNGALAIHRVEQVGRHAADDAGHRAISFSDRSYAGEVFGGVIETDEGPVRVAALGKADVWPARAAQQRAAACRSSAEFDRAYGDARKARGYARTVETSICEGRVDVLGTLRRNGSGELQLDAASDGTLLVSVTGLRAVCRNKVLLLTAFSIATPLAAGVCTALALHPPVFGTVSTIGAALGLAYFLLVQPAGTAVRDAVRLPADAILRGSWLEGRDLERAPAETTGNGASEAA